MKDTYFHIRDWENALVAKYPNVNIRAVGGGRHEAVTPHDEFVGGYSIVRGGGWIK